MAVPSPTTCRGSFHVLDGTKTGRELVAVVRVPGGITCYSSATTNRGGTAMINPPLGQHGDTHVLLVPAWWYDRWPNTQTMWGDRITVTYDGFGSIVNIVGAPTGMDADELEALIDSNLRP